jgi:hypothetical protein
MAVATPSCWCASPALPPHRGELRLREGQLSQRNRPGDPLRAPLRLGYDGRADVLVAEQPEQLRLPRPHPDDILGGTDLSDDRDRLLVVVARAGELAAHGDPVRQLGQGERNPPPFAERPELGERHLQVRVRIPPALAEHDPHLAER